MDRLDGGSDGSAEVIDFEDAIRAPESVRGLQAACEIQSVEGLPGAVAVLYLARSGRFGESAPISACSVRFVLSDGSMVQARRRRDPLGFVGSPVRLTYRTIGVLLIDPVREIVEVVLRVPGTKKTFRLRNVSRDG